MPNQSPVPDERDRTIQILFFLFLFLLVAVGALLLESEQEFYKALGHALMIAGILGVSIDPYIKQRLLKESLRSIDTTLIGYGLPRELQDKIKEIMRTTIVRNPMHLHYKLVPLDGQDNIRLETQITYELENISPVVEWFTQYVYVETYNKPVIKRLCCTLDDQRLKYCFDEQMLRDKNLLRADGKLIKAFGEDISLQPSHPQRPKKYKFYCEYTEILPRDHSYTFKLALAVIKTIHVTVTAQYPREFTFGTSLETVEDLATPRASDSWVATRAFLPGEDIGVWWEPKRDRNASSDAKLQNTGVTGENLAAT